MSQLESESELELLELLELELLELELGLSLGGLYLDRTLSRLPRQDFFF